MSLKRLLFASCHGYVDPSNGAATATRDLMELLAARGVDCRVLSTGVLDYHQETPLGPLLDTLEVEVREVRAGRSDGASVDVFDFNLGGVRVTLLPTASSRIERSPDRDESEVFLDLADQVLGRFRPQVLLTYGGHPANLALMAQARRRGFAVVFYLHNFAYDKPSALPRRLRRAGSDRLLPPVLPAADRAGVYDDPLPVPPAPGPGRGP
jgi:hypothetical protein